MMQEPEQQDSDSTKFVFVVTAHNCQDTIAQTLLTMAAQSYDDWRAILFADACTDHTAEQVQRTVGLLGLADRFRLFASAEKQGEVKNTLDAMSIIEPDEVICRLDGGDWLVDNDLLAIFDAAYRSDPNIVVAWCAHRWNFSRRNISGPLNDDAEGNYEDVYANPDRWVSSHMKTWRRSAADGINDANFRDVNGKPIMNACDRAVYLPILQKAALDKKRRVFIPFVGYHYVVDESPENIDGPRAKEQRKTAEFIYKRGFVA